MLALLIALCRLFLHKTLTSFRVTFHTMKLNDDQSESIFPLLQLASSSPVKRDMALKVKESVPVLPKIDCRSKSSSSGSSSYRGKYSGSCPRGLSSNSRKTGSSTSSSSRNGRLYTPVEFEITPIALPYMGTDYRKVGRVRRVPKESSAIKQNEVQHKSLERKTHSLSRRRDQIEKDYTRTLSLWHMEQERNKNHKDHAQQRRAVRIVKFMDKIANPSENFHFKEGFFLDLMDPEYFPEPPPSPININRLDSKRPIFKPPSPNEGRAKSTGHFHRRDSKAEALARLEEKFSECKRAGEVKGYGYVYVKIHTDPYYRYLPPLSDASKNYTVRLARLPHKRLRNEEQWRKFLDSLRPKTPPPPPPQPRAPTIQEMRKARTDELKKKLPIISLLPKWLREVRDKNDIRTARYRKEDEQPILELVETVNKKTGIVDSSSPVTVSRPLSRVRIERRKPSPITITESHTKEDMDGVIKTLKPTFLDDQQQHTKTVEDTLETPIKHRIRASR